jgi:hypothetical protein
MPACRRRPHMASTPPAPPLLVDNRATLGTVPMLHAVLIGVSDYSALPAFDDPPGDGLAALKQLQSAALSALRVADKLKALDAAGRLLRPLGSIRLLVAPSDAEKASDPRLAAGNFALPTIANIKAALRAWRLDAARFQDSQALLLFSGHGIRRAQEESILLAQDFLVGRDEGTPEMEATFQLSNIRSGMVPSARFPTIARDQFYFVDACRDMPSALNDFAPIESPAVFTAELNIQDYRYAPIFFATIPGGKAAGVAGQPTYFTKALLWALENGCADKTTLKPAAGSSSPLPPGKIWPVTAVSLKAGIEASDALFEGRVELTGLVGGPVLCFRKDAPELNLKFRLEPGPLRQHVTDLNLVHQDDNKLTTPITPVPDSEVTVKLIAGPYRAVVTPDAPTIPCAKSDMTWVSLSSTMAWTFDMSGET